MDVPRAKPWSGQNVKYAQYKLDGHYAQIQRDEFGALRMWNRNEVDETGLLPRVLNDQVWRVLPPGTHLHGEVWYPGRRSSYVTSAKVQSDLPLWFSCFAMNGTAELCDRYGITRTCGLSKIEALCKKWALRFAPFIRLDASATPDKLIAEPLPFLYNHPIEGFVFKNGNLSDYYKWKPTKTIDLIVTGYKPANLGKYFGQIGSVLCSTSEGHEVAAVSGMDDDIRDWFDGHQQTGFIIEVAYQNAGEKGRLRHPRFVRVREDKILAHCGVNQDAELAKLWVSQENENR